MKLTPGHNDLNDQPAKIIRVLLCKESKWPDYLAVNESGWKGVEQIRGTISKTFHELQVHERAQFHQRSMYSFYARRSQKRKKTLMT